MYAFFLVSVKGILYLLCPLDIVTNKALDWIGVLSITCITEYIEYIEKCKPFSLFGHSHRLTGGTQLISRIATEKKEA